MFYFLSSTRRHTRWPRDWSSDVCSSDLKASELNNVSPAMIMPPTNVKCMQDRWKDFGNEFITANVLNAVYAHLNDGEFWKAAKKVVKTGVKGSLIGVATELTISWAKCK